jgi:hypothetical protein
MKLHITTSIVVYVHGRNAKFYNTMFVSYYKNKNFGPDDTTKDIYLLCFNLFFKMCPITPQNKDRN